MGLYRFISPVDGQEYPFEIDGDVPSNEESQAIKNYMAGLYKKEIPEEPGDDGNLFTKGIARGIDNLQLLYGSAIEGAGEVTGIEALKDYGSEVIEKNREELNSQAESAKRLDDIQGVGSFFDWTASTLGEQIPQLGSTLGGAGAGAAIGSFLGPPGAVVGSIIGGMAANLPFFYGGNREAQKQEVRAGNRIEISEGAAALTAIPQAALDFIADRFLISGFTAKALTGGGIFTRGAKGIVKGAIVEVPTEVGQQVLERLQAGQDILSEEALDEYLEVAAAAGLVGGTVRGSGAVIMGDTVKSAKKAKETEMLEDQRVEQQSVNVMNNNANTILTREKDANDFKDSSGKFITLSQLPDHIKQEVKDTREQRITFADVVSGAVDPDVEINKEILSKEDLNIVVDRVNDMEADTTDADYNKVKDAVKKNGEFNQKIAKQALVTKKKKIIPQSKINAIRDKLLANGIIKKEKNKLIPATTTEQDLRLKAEQLKARVKVILKDIGNLHNKKTQKSKKENLTPEEITELDTINENIDNLSIEYDKVAKKAQSIVNESNRKLGKDIIRLPQIIPSLEAKNAFDNANIKTPEYKAKELKVQKALQKSLKDMGLGGLKLNFVDLLTKPGKSKEQQIASGTINEGNYFNKTIALAMTIYDPSLTEAELQQKLGSVMNHEIIHAIFELGIFTPQEQKILMDVANKKKYVVIKDGKPVERKYTYMERAAKMYPNLDDTGKAEEAVAEMYRDFADGKLKFAGKPKTLLQRIVNFIKSIFTAHSEQGFNTARDLFSDIGSTKFQKRAADAFKVNNTIKSNVKHSTAGIVAGYIEPEKGNIERIKLAFKDVTKRLDELQEAAKKLANGEIDYDAYDKLVNKVKPIVPYSTVPEPASVEAMRGALAKNKISKLNKINEVPNRELVRLRLDIPAYRDKGVWVPTIHDSKNKVISHESVAIVNNAHLEPSAGAQRIGLRIAQGAEKGPFATIEGKLEKTTPDDAFIEAQAALNDPAFVQVGFDPERHSYFYDRTTTQPVIAADRVIQVGPLVLAKNPTFGKKQDYKYSTIGFAKPEPLDNRLLGIIKDNPDGFTVDPDSLEDMSSGVAVAPVKAAEIKVKPQDLNEETLYQFAENIYIMSQLSKTKIFAGGWTGPDGMFYLDATMLVDDFNDALYIGEAAEQEGIFNLSNFEYTDTNDGIKKLQETGAYDGKRRAERQRDIRKLTEEFKKTRYQRQAEQKSRISSPTRIEAGQERSVEEQVGYYPTVDDEGYTTITHYSPEEGLAVISPDKQGTNFNIRGAETRRRSIFPSRFPARSYFGLNVGESGGYRKETGVGDNTYKGKIEVNRLYPLDADPNGYRVEAAKQAQEEERGGPDTGRLAATLLEKRIQDEGFVGYWTGQQLGMVAAIFDDVAVLPEGQEKFSVKGVSAEDISILGRLDENGQFIQSAKPNSVKMTEAVKKLHAEKGGIVLDINDAEDRALAEETIFLELKAFFDADESAIGWYDDKIKTAKKLYSMVIPEIATDKNAESAFEYLLAITSNGEAVISQNASIKKHMTHWLETGRLLEDNQGSQASAMNKSFLIYNLLKEKGLTDLEIKQFFQIKMSKNEIESHPDILELNEILEKPINITGESVNETVPMSFIFGSKIGSFYQNIIGNYEYLTMDRWFMRSMNRILGTPFRVVTDKTLEKNRRESLEAFQIALESGTEDEVARIKVATDEMGVDLINNSNITELASILTTKFQKDLKTFSNKEGTAKQFAEQFKTDLFRKAESLHRNSTDMLQESPKGPVQRQRFRQMFANVVEKFNRQSNRKITIADSQAVYWYGEKRLFKSIGVRSGQGSDNDYVDAAIDFLRKEGIDEETIGEALPAAEREQRLGDRDTGRASFDSTGQVAQNIGYEKRRKTREELVSFDPTKDLSNDEIIGLKEDIDNNKYSIIGNPSKENLPRSDINKYIYAMISRDPTNPKSPRFAVLYPSGEHFIRRESPKETLYGGFGQKHIEAPRNQRNRFGNIVGQKSRAEEILEIFNEYNTIEELLEDQLSNYQMQQDKGVHYGIELNFDQGAELIFNRVKVNPNNPRRYQLVIPLKFIRRDTPIDQFERDPITDEPIQTGIDNQGNPIYQTALKFKNTDVFVPRTIIAKEKLEKQSTLGSPVMNQQATPTSDTVNQSINQTRTKITYDNLSKVLAKMGHTLTLGRVEEETVRRKAQDLLIQLQDRFLPIGTLLDDLRAKGITIADAMDTYMQEERFHGIAGAKVDRSQKEFFEPMIKVIDSLNVDEASLNELSRLSEFYRTAIDGRYPSKKMALADAILYAAHAKERNDYLGNNIASGMHTNEAIRILDWVKSLPQDEETKIKNVIKFAQTIVKNTNEERKQGGLIPEVFVDKDGNEYTELYDNYVPLRGDLDFEQEIDSDNKAEERKENFIIQNLFGAVNKPDRKARGRIRSGEDGLENYYASDLVATLFAQNNKSIADAERNKVGLSYLQLVRGLEEGETEVNVNLQKEMQHISGVYFNRKDIPKDQQGDGSLDPERQPYLTVRENGQNVYITFNDARIARAMKGMMTPDSVGAFTRVLGKLNRYLSNINTTYNPSFVIPNFARDLATAGVNVQQFDEKAVTSEVLKGAFGAVRGISKNLRDGDTESFWAKEYLKFVNAGGKNATNQMNDLQDQMNRINGILSDVADNGKKGKLGLVKKGFKSLGKFLDDYNTAVENGVRVATYTALVKRGFTSARAAQAARNITVNFAKGGEQKQFFNSWYLFYNASFQGSMALINAAVRSSKVRKVWAGLVAYGVLQDQINALASDDEDNDGINDYDELPRYILEHNFVLPTFGLAGDKFITIPLAYGMNIATNLGRSMSRAARGEYTPGQASRSIFGTAFESLSPFGGFDNMYNLVAPTVLDPFVSVAINEDYKGDPIFKESPQFASRPTPNSQAYWSSTGRIPKFIADQLNTLSGGDAVESGIFDMSPDVMEFWFEYMTGGVGRFVQRSAEAPFNIIDAINGDFQGAITTAIPFARKVVTSPSEREDVSNYLENRKAVFTILARYDLARRTGDSVAINEVLQDYRKELAIIPRLKTIDNARNRLLRQIREVERNPRIEDKLKRNLIRIRRQRINDLMRRGLILMRSAGFREAS